ncbi:MAG TPA: hypothetical protein VMT96_00320 [Candidatus Bathyarchaeia archaeon]|nr:hypothetical protein [Candidatus Bathyarchaeia archaeon]
MVAIQTTRFRQLYLFLTTAVILISTVGLLIFAAPHALATNGCAGTENPGTGANAGKCVNADGSIATDTPQGTTPGRTPTATNNNSTTCAVEKVGWILCPVIEVSAKIGDQAFNFLAKFFLQTEPELFANNSGTRVAWETARNLANIMFIIAFLIIIISQVSGRGIDNYGIKRMLPRLIVAAIAVNVSYYICQAAVDLSNIAGWEIKDWLVGIAQQISSRTAMPVQTSIDNQTANGVLAQGTLAVMAIGVLALTGVVIYLLPMLLGTILTILVVVLTIIIILILRKAIIVLLVVVSPIAFVCYLLPNTEKFFDKWLKMFGQLLMVFPVVALLFGGGQLASGIILVAGSHGDTQCTGNNDNNCSVYADTSKKCIQLPASTSANNSNGNITSTSTDDGAKIANCTPTSTPLMLGLVAAGLSVAPLVAVWAVLKGALSAAGAIGGKISAGISKGSGGLMKLAKANDESQRKLYQARALDGGFGRRTASFMRRRNINSAVRDSRLSAAQEKFEAGDPRARKLDEQKRLYDLQGQAAKTTAAKDFNDQLAQGVYTDSLGRPVSAGQYGPGIQDAFGLQQARALSEAVKDTEFQMSGSTVDQLADKLEGAYQAHDVITARAMQNLLYGAGDAGRSRARTIIGSHDTDAAYNDITSKLQENIRANHGGLKDLDPSQMEWATKGGSLAAKFSDANTYNKLNASQFASLGSSAQAEAAKHLSQQTRDDLLKDNNAQLLAAVKEAGRTTLASVDARFQ